MTSDRGRLSERRALVARDVEELAVQVSAGEITVEDSADLLTAYQRELETLDAALAKLPKESVSKGGETVEASVAKGRSPRQVLAVAIVLIAVLTVAIAIAGRNVGGDEPVAASAPGALTVDPATVTNEQLEAVVAANPDLNAMRMALADRYFRAKDYGSAIDHYLYILDNAPSGAEETKALARMGWIAYSSGLAEAGHSFVLQSLSVDPENAEAKIFLGFITMYGLEDPEAAIPQLEAALALPDLPDSLVSELEKTLAEARSTP